MDATQGFPVDVLRHMCQNIEEFDPTALWLSKYSFSKVDID